MKRTERTLDRTFGPRRPNSREVLTETIGASGKTTLIGSRDDSMVPLTVRRYVTFDAPLSKTMQVLQASPRARTPDPTLRRTFKLGSPSTLTGLVQNGLPQLAEPAIEAECVYAFVGECEWPVKSKVTCVISTENGLERSNTLGGEGIMGSSEDSVGVKTEGIISSVVQEAPILNKEVRLIPGERMGWWSAQKFDRRNSQRPENSNTPRYLSIVSARYAKTLGLRDIPNQDCSMDIQGISKEKATTIQQ
ncbi:hypothetical protein PHMEG_00029957 [Phytophthora megakarya]|uniref:Eukaryotic/viral aspartic protease n=1 Tax=Phytophthora megakarya TaxID=4795 RepID=A0A225UZY8_9STRA|nr:hypothetical protein PHMEG_00029957 [Phytophthora megakarya]